MYLDKDSKVMMTFSALTGWLTWSMSVCDVWLVGTCTRTTVSWSWPVSPRRRWTVGRLLSCGLECTLNAAWYNLYYSSLANYCCY